MFLPQIDLKMMQRCVCVMFKSSYDALSACVLNYMDFYLALAGQILMMHIICDVYVKSTKFYTTPALFL